MRNLKEENERQHSGRYVEILGDTVLPIHAILSIIISILFGLGGFIAGKYFLKDIAGDKMLESYSLLIGIAGCIFAVIISALLFKPKRTLSENEITTQEAHTILNDLDINFAEEMDSMAHDPVTKREMEDLKIKDLFISESKGDNL